ncbi:MAG: tripartite tricarboxylate transporter substrate binding protein [Succinatimonas sp.]|nr:tripartite tricarboxylate transporter substrate binding protein [Succinatimonas sp.]
MVNKYLKFVKYAAATVALSCFALQAADAAPKFPRKQIQIVVPYAPGGASDTVARIYGKELEKELGKPVVVVNRTGASGAVGLESVKNSRPDGYTMSYMPVESTMISALGLSDISSDDFTFVCRIMTIPAAITVSADAPWNTLEEFLQYAKENPGKLTVGNSGPGSIWNVAAASLEKATDVKFTHVPFDGAAPAIAALLGKNISAVAVSPSEVKTNVDAGQFKVLAVIGDQHSSVVPDVKTTKELGIDVSAMGWGGFAVPKGTPDEVVQILNDASAKVAQSADLKKLLADRGFEYAYLNGKDMDAFAKDQLTQYKELIPQLIKK